MTVRELIETCENTWKNPTFKILILGEEKLIEIGKKYKIDPNYLELKNKKIKYWEWWDFTLIIKIK